MYIVSFFIRSCGPIHHWIQETRGTKVRSADMPFPHGKLNEPLWISGNSDSGFLWCFMYTYMVNVQGQAVRFRKGIGCAPQDCGDHRHCYMSNRGFQVQAKPSFTTLTGRPPHPNNIHTHRLLLPESLQFGHVLWLFVWDASVETTGVRVKRKYTVNIRWYVDLLCKFMMGCSISIQIYWGIKTRYVVHISSFTVSKLPHILKSRGEKE